MNTLKILLKVIKTNGLAGKSVSVGVILSMDNPHSSIDNILVDRHTSTDNPSTDKSSSRNLNSFNRSMNLGGASQSQRSYSNQEIPIDDQEASSSRSSLPPQRKWTKSHPFELIIGDAGDGVKTRSATQNEFLYNNFRSQEEPTKVEEALQDADWVLSMQEELNQFERKQSVEAGAQAKK